MLEKFSLPSILLLNKIQQGRIDSIKALKILPENEKILNLCMLMVDEMYLEKTAQYHGCDYVGADDRETLIPYIVQAIPEVKFSGEWLADKILNCIDDLTSAKTFCTRYSH